MLAILFSLAAIRSMQAPPDFSETNTFGAVRLDLPLSAKSTSSSDAYAGVGPGIDFRLTINHSTTGGSLPEKTADRAAAKLKSSPGMKTYRGGSILPVKLGGVGG